MVPLQLNIRFFIPAVCLLVAFHMPLEAGDLLDSFFTGPMAGTEEIIFAVRQPGVDHWYGNFGYYAQSQDHKVYHAAGQLVKLNLRTGRQTILLDDREGCIRDPQVHYDGAKILFSYRPGGTDYFHLYEIGINGEGLQQLTHGPWDDMEPTYLPDGGIMFCSSRCKRWVNCWLTQVAILHRCDADGSNIQQISANIEQDNTPWPLPDGRVLYTRWEYVDRSQVHYHHLWATNPDGTRQMIFYGNQRPGKLMIDAKPIPGTQKIVSVFSPGHGKPEHTGEIAVVTSVLGPDADTSAVIITPGKRDFRDPFPFSEDCFLVARRERLYVINGEGMAEEIYRLPDVMVQMGAEVHEPRPIQKRPRERIIPSRIDLARSTGNLVLTDIYNGRHMEGLQRGDITHLLILETLPKPINYTGGMEPLSYGGTFTLERILGTVPVEPDGSAFIELPADRPVFFIALDAGGRAVKRMQSFVSVRPGETTSCVGCHEYRTQTPPAQQDHVVAALLKPPSSITPIPDVPEIFDFPRDIQPILDRNCLSCHDTKIRAGGVLLTGDRGPLYSHSYFTLSAHQQIADGRNRAQSNYAPRAVGSSASPLMQKLDGGHHGVKVTEHERCMVQLWIDSGAPYPGTYAALGSGMIGGYAQNSLDRSDLQWKPVSGAAGIIKKQCSACHTGTTALPESPSDNMGMPPWDIKYGDPRLRFSRHILYNLTRPEQSLMLLAPLAQELGGYGICRDSSAGLRPVFTDLSDETYQWLLSSVRFTAQRLHEIKRFDMPGFRPPAPYVREMQRFGILPRNLPADAIINPYETDRRYWESLWHQPEAFVSHGDHPGTR